MRKFTIFTFILSIIIVVVVAEIFINDYWPGIKAQMGFVGSEELTLDLPDTIGANVLDGETGTLNTAGINTLESTLEGPSNGSVAGDSFAEYDMNEFSFGSGNEAVEPLVPMHDLNSGPGSSGNNTGAAIVVSEPGSGGNANNGLIAADFEDENFNDFSQSVLLTEEHLKNSGFTGAYLENEPHNGYLYKTIYVDDLYDVELQKHIIRSTGEYLAKVYILSVGPLSSVDEVYEVVKVRGTEGLDIEVNETNDYGSKSFYINDMRRPNVAFLTTKVGDFIYGFSYPKKYHPQVKNLIKLIEMEIK